MLIDVFFDFAAPLAIATVVVASIVIRTNKQGEFYASEEGIKTRDEINKKYKMNTAAIVIGILTLMVYGLVAAEIFEWAGKSGTFFAIVVSVLLLIPFLTVYAGLVLIYTLLVHAIGNMKK